MNNVVLNRIRNLANNFRRAESGNIAVLFALAILPVMGFVGAAIDYSRANSARASLQSALDTTALMLSKEVTTLTNDDLIKQKAQQYFNALYQNPEIPNIALNVTYTGTSSILLKASAALPTTIMKIAGFSSMSLGASSTTKWGNTRLRVALVLDNTLSMADNGKMAALKTATKNLLQQLKASASADGDVYVSIVPFNTNINIGRANFTQPWIDWTDWEEGNGSCSDNSSTSKATCLQNAKIWTPKNHNTWNGCVVDRGPANKANLTATGRDYDQIVDPPTASILNSKIPAEKDPFATCLSPMMELSYSWSALNTLVDNLTPTGNTNQGIGLVWGWQSLVGGGPLPAPPPMNPAFKYQQVIILLSDGLNTSDRWYTNSEIPKVNARMYDANGNGTCKNIKDGSIILYTIHIDTTSGPESQLLRNCASDGRFSMLRNSTQIITTFEAIGTELSQLRLAQ